MNLSRKFSPMIAFSAALLLGMLLMGCESLQTEPLTSADREIREFEVQGLKIGSPRKILANYAEVNKMPGFTSEGLEKFEILNPAPQISMIVAFFYEGKVRRLEIRYFDGTTARTLTRAGGWQGIRNYIVGKFGAPTETGSKVPVVADQPGLNPEYAKFNGVWKFPRVNRQLNYIAMADNRGGVGIVTVTDTRPIPKPVIVREATATTQQTTSSTTPSGTRAQIHAAPQTPDPGF